MQVPAVGSAAGASPSDHDLVAAFARDQRRRGLLRSTIETRASRLRTFQRWLAGRPLADVTEEDVEQFLDERQIGSRTRYCWLSHLHALYTSALNAGLVVADPTVRITRPRLRRLLPRPIADADLQAVIGRGGAPPDLKAWLLLMAYGGLRCAEVAAMERSDVLDSNDPPVLLVHGKGDKPRVVPAHPEVLWALRVLPMAKYGRLFLRPLGGPWPPAQVSRRVALFLHELGIDASAHSLRHWFGTHLYATTKDLRLVQEVMGHSSPTTTAGYTYWSNADATAAVRRLRIGSASRSTVTPSTTG